MIKQFCQIKIAVIFSFVLILSAQNAKAGILDIALDSLRNLVRKEQKVDVVPVLADDSAVLKVTSQTSASSDASVAFEKDEEVLKGVVGPVRLATENEVYENDQIQVYEVKNGDTLSDVAKMFNVSRNTIAWANDIKNGKLTPGDTLLILPVSGVKHTIKKGDTIKSIAKKYKASSEDILSFNDIDEDNLVVGEVVIVPDGEMVVDAPVVKSKPKRKVYASAGVGYYTRPIIGGVKTQGIHGHNGVDIGAPVGSPILAAAEGVVLAAKPSGYNGGYGKMVIISHPNGTQTVYGHLSSVYVTTGQSVSKGEQIGESGNTGRSTGPHLHFEVRGAENPF
jgi:LysM repeat protein